MKIIFTLAIAVLLSASASYAAKLDSVNVKSSVMDKAYYSLIILPESYFETKDRFPVMYLLHGGNGHNREWMVYPSNKMILYNLADQFNIIIALPVGEAFSYYIDSPVDKDSQFETYITKDVVQKIDNTYRTIRERKGRLITGLSMGGYGSLFLATRHPELFVAAGSMSGALNPDMKNWKLPPDATRRVKWQFEQILGPVEQNIAYYNEISAINLADKMKTSGVKLIIDCGVDDFLIEPNRELHRKLLFNGTEHDYIERPGAHRFDYWENALPYHMLFFSNVLKRNGVSVSPKKRS